MISTEWMDPNESHLACRRPRNLCTIGFLPAILATNLHPCRPRIPRPRECPATRGHPQDRETANAAARAGLRRSLPPCSCLLRTGKNRSMATAKKFYIIHAVCSAGNNPRRVNQKVFGIQDARSPLKNTKFYLSKLLRKCNLMKHP